MTSELRQLRRVRWGVRLTLALGISASLAANVLHAHHLLIDQIISGWPPVAVFATIEAIARVPIRRRWLAVIRMTGLGFVAAIAFWVSYWHMASVAAAHGENGSKYLLPLSVDGLVVVVLDQPGRAHRPDQRRRGHHPRGGGRRAGSDRRPGGRAASASVAGTA